MSLAVFPRLSKLAWGVVIARQIRTNLEISLWQNHHYLLQDGKKLMVTDSVCRDRISWFAGYWTRSSLDACVWFHCKLSKLFFCKKRLFLQRLDSNDILVLCLVWQDYSKNPVHRLFGSREQQRTGRLREPHVQHQREVRGRQSCPIRPQSEHSLHNGIIRSTWRENICGFLCFI